MSGTPYAVMWTEAADLAKRQLPPHVQVVVNDTVYWLAQDPDRWTARGEVADSQVDARVYVLNKPRVEITFTLGEKPGVLIVTQVAQKVLSTHISALVFISYSHADRKWLHPFRTHIRELEKKGLVTFWDDQQIQAGQDWLQEITNSLTKAKVAVLLVTPDFLYSDFIQECEMPMLLNASQGRACVVFWIPVRWTDWQDGPLARFQAAHDPMRPLSSLRPPARDRALAAIGRRLSEVVSEINVVALGERESQER